MMVINYLKSNLLSYCNHLKSGKSANIDQATEHIFAEKKMKNHILFSNRNWKHELKNSVETEKARALKAEAELEERVSFAEDEMADAFDEIYEERKKIDNEIVRSTSIDNQLQQSIETETSRARREEQTLNSGCAICFDGIINSEISLSEGEPDTIDGIFFSEHHASFVARTPMGYFHSTFSDQKRYMENGSLFKNKIYICGNSLYVWNGERLSDVLSLITENIEALSTRITEIEKKL